MKDRYSREIEYLRVSVTDRCNLRCRYCMPEEGVQAVPHSEILTFAEIQRLVGLMAGMGVKKVRLTGGEPLVRRGVEQLAAGIKARPGIQTLALTTNGLLLGQKAKALKEAGVSAVNLSLDTLNPARYEALTRRDGFAAAWQGLQAALAEGFEKIKVNCVLSPESSWEDWLAVAALAKTLPVDVRFIEWMPIASEGTGQMVQAPQLLAGLARSFGPLQSLSPEQGGGPAEYYRADGFVGRLGVIHAMSNCFCAACNRVRLTSTGELKLCLFYDEGVALKPLLRGGASDEEIRQAVRQAILRKPRQHRGHRLAVDQEGEGGPLINTPCGMFSIGG